MPAAATAEGGDDQGPGPSPLPLSELAPAPNTEDLFGRRTTRVDSSREAHVCKHLLH